MLPWGVVALVSAIWWQFNIRNDAPEPPPAKNEINIRMFMRSKLAWQVMLVFGFQSMNAYATRTWLPTIMVSKGFTIESAGATVAIAGLIGALLAIGVPHFAQRSKDQRPTIWIVSMMAATSYIGIEFGSHSWIIFWVFMSNMAQWLIYPLALLLIIMRSPTPDQGQSLSAMVQTFGYVLGAAAPLITGALFDITGAWKWSLWVLVSVSIGQALAGQAAGRIGFVKARDLSK